MARRHAKHEEEEHENHERWLISYADMITLLMVLFVVMFAISNVDQKKFAALSEGLAAGFGAPRYIVSDGGQAVIDGKGAMIDPVQVSVIAPPVPVPPAQGETALEQASPADAAEAQQAVGDAQAELASLDEIAAEAREALATEGLESRADFRVTEDGLVVVLFADDVFFTSASAELQPTGARVVDALAPVLADSGRPVDAEGHANHLPVRSTSAYPSNWELSAARAASVVRRLIEVDGLDGSRLTAAGYSDTRPLVPPSDPTSIEVNRRVDLLVRSTARPEVRALLPQLAEARRTAAG
ncbi:flagellar motor protein MotB [Aquipuribacter nitratireducens]|uniref:Flagellar motor protein MotB n=1 Tax=Aquipuribacter nitratireducens TaxID=650104 RepID=A0ABW0GPP9_9MICO